MLFELFDEILRYATQFSSLNRRECTSKTRERIRFNSLKPQTKIPRPDNRVDFLHIHAISDSLNIKHKTSFHDFRVVQHNVINTSFMGRFAFRVLDVFCSRFLGDTISRHFRKPLNRVCVF